MRKEQVACDEPNTFVVFVSRTDMSNTACVANVFPSYLERYAVGNIKSIKTPPLCTTVSTRSAECLDHRAAEVGERALGFAGVFTRLEHP
jgi:hypothetical protein